jgi:formylmethanofuran dehydrogenase subunit C
MSGWTLRLRQQPTLRVDLHGVTPAALASAQAAGEVERLRVGHGREWVALGELFSIGARDDDTLVLEGDLHRFDRVGCQMEAGALIIDGAVGHHAGAEMRGGEMRVRGDAGALAACEMSGGLLSLEGNVGDFAASALPGSMDGMRGGTLIVKGRAGERFGDRMRRGTAVVFGDAGDFLASRMVAGTIALAGRCGAHPAYGMRRGSIVFAGATPQMPTGFVPIRAGAEVFWQLLARDLARHGGVFADLPSRRIERWCGDLAADGKGELIVLR